MKNLILLSALTTILVLSSCGKAGEDRDAMYARAKVFQDSIANVIKLSMQEAEAPAAPAMMPATVEAVPQPTPGK
jgi:hypothetical protein